MNIVFLNPPNNERIQRRYMCSYNAGSMLLPPQELIALAGIAKKFKGCSPFLVDAIAEQLDSAVAIQKLKLLQPDLVVSIHGFECFEEDIKVLEEIKEQLPGAKLILFGHYATLFPEEILAKTNLDIIILGEPDNILGHLLEAFVQNKEISAVSGIAYRTGTEIVVQRGDERITRPELLPMPAYELLKAEHYFEPFLKPPLGLIQSARGCPYNCNYCVRSFGKRLTYRTTDQIIEEILFMKERFGIRSLRFIDDTFTVHTKRVIEICQKMIDLKIDIQWTCLSRVDTLREEMIPLMKEAGCKRIYFGAESGSPTVLTYLNKEINLSNAISSLRLCRANGIETLGFFMVGSPAEGEAEFNASVDFAIEADFDYITVSELIPYAGTELFENLKGEINFSLFPYVNEWKDGSIKERNKLREKEFYRRFYFRKKYLAQNAKKALKHPMEFFDNFKMLSMYLISQPQNKRVDLF